MVTDHVQHTVKNTMHIQKHSNVTYYLKNNQPTETKSGMTEIITIADKGIQKSYLNIFHMLQKGEKLMNIRKEI